jgi:PhnB protein
MSEVKPCPDDMKWVNPYLTVKDAEAAIAFYNQAFGFETRLIIPGPDGKPAHVELLHKDSVIMLGPEQHEAKSPASVGGTSISLYTYVEDVDALCQRARAAGAKVMVEPADMFWGDRLCHIVDPEGHVWAFATHIKDVSPEEMHPPTA